MNIHFIKFRQNPGRIPALLFFIISGVLIMLFNTCSQIEHNSSTIPEKSKQSSHYDNGTFTNGRETLNMTPKDWFSSTWRFMFEKNHQIPEIKLPVQKADLTRFKSRATGGLTSTWLGHSSLMINIDGYRILTDPVFPSKVSPIGPSRFNGPVPVDPRLLPELDIVIISHDHYDHLNKKSIQALMGKTKWFAVPLVVGQRLISWGVQKSQIIEMDWWDTFHFDDTLTLHAAPAQHFSGRGLLDRNKTLWASWVIETDSHKIFFSGDSGYFDGFKTIGEKFGPFDVTFLECGAYDQMWHNVHMFPEETIQAHLDLKGRILHPIHWGTYKLALHPWYEPMQRALTAAEKHNIILATPIAGQTTDYHTKDLGHAWWEVSKKTSAPEDDKTPARG